MVRNSSFSIENSTSIIDSMSSKDIFPQKQIIAQESQSPASALKREHPQDSVIHNGGTVITSSNAIVSKEIVLSGGSMTNIKLPPLTRASLSDNTPKTIVKVYPPSTVFINPEAGNGGAVITNGGMVTLNGSGVTVVLAGAAGNTGLVIENLSNAVNNGATIIVTPEIKHFDDIAAGFPPPGYVPPTYDPTNQIWRGGDSDGIILQGVKRSDIIGIYSGDSDLSNVPKDLRKYLTGANAGNYALIQTKSGGWILLHIDGIGDRGVIGVDKNGQIIFEVCYLEGTRILTPNGYKKIENLYPGDLVEVANQDGSHGKRTLPLKWIGKKKIWVKTENSDLLPDEAGYAIRISKNAFEDNLPENDLWVTPEHSFLFDGKFVPARMLVNGKSIAYDYKRTSYTYYHLETDPHSILIAEGACAESYLDTGNRSHFISVLDPHQENNASILRLPPKLPFPNNKDKNRQEAAVPFDTSRAFVEPLWKKLAHRANLKHSTAKASVNALGAAITNKSNFSVMLQLPEGKRVPLICQKHSQIEERHLYAFSLPPDLPEASTLLLSSRQSRPFDAIGPYVDDRRKLGVLVKNITFIMPQASYSPTQWQTDETLEGWANIEPMPLRWTTGKALLPLPNSLKEIKNIQIEIIAQGPYLLPS